MDIQCDSKKTEAKLLALEEYLISKTFGTNSVCTYFEDCKQSHSETFYEGQFHHLGKHYDLFYNRRPLRTVVVGQEYGHSPSHVDCNARYDMVMKSGLEYRFKAGNGFKARNPHMRGTTNLLRLLLGIPLGADYESEFIKIGGRSIHLFDTIALVNYLLCSAIGSDGKKRGKATQTMLRNCREHFRNVLTILEPTVAIVQGKSFWKSVIKSFNSVKQESETIFRARLGRLEIFVAVFTHPSAQFP